MDSVYETILLQGMNVSEQQRFHDIYNRSYEKANRKTKKHFHDLCMKIEQDKITHKDRRNPIPVKLKLKMKLLKKRNLESMVLSDGETND
jgi:hypothetical protein